MSNPPDHVEDTADAVVASGEAVDEDVVEPHGGGVGAAAGVVAVTLAGIGAFLNLYATQPLLPGMAAVYRRLACFA